MTQAAHCEQNNYLVALTWPLSSAVNYWNSVARQQCRNSSCMQGPFFSPRSSDFHLVSIIGVMRIRPIQQLDDRDVNDVQRTAYNELMYSDGGDRTTWILVHHILQLQSQSCRWGSYKGTPRAISPSLSRKLGNCDARIRTSLV